MVGRQGVVEYIEEVTFGTFPTNPAMKWLGLIQNFKLDIIAENEDYRTLKASGATNKLAIEGNVTSGQTLNADIEYMVQNWDFFKWGLSLTGAGTPTDTLASLSFELISPDVTPKYAAFSGGVIDSINVEIPEKKAAVAKASLKFGHVKTTTNNPWEATTHIGSGSHASKASTAPIAFSAITTCTWGGSAFKASNIKFGYKNNLQDAIDADSTLSTKAAGFTPDARDFTFGCTIKKSAIDAIAALVVAGTPQTLILTISGATFTFLTAKIPKDTVELAPKGLTSLDIEFVGISSLAIT